MRHRPTVRLMASDRGLFDRAAATLDAADYRVADDPARAEPPTLILRHWQDPSRLEETSVPVLTLDLTLFTGDDLVEMVDRIIGRRRVPWR